eukprot:351335-Chlamydomonas_euryale.AAC.10
MAREHAVCRRPARLYARDEPKHALQLGQRSCHQEQGARVAVHDTVAERARQLQREHVVLQRHQIQLQLANGHITKDALRSGRGKASDDRSCRIGRSRGRAGSSGHVATAFRKRLPCDPTEGTIVMPCLFHDKVQNTRNQITTRYTREQRPDWLYLRLPSTHERAVGSDAAGQTVRDTRLVLQHTVARHGAARHKEHSKVPAAVCLCCPRRNGCADLLRDGHSVLDRRSDDVHDIACVCAWCVQQQLIDWLQVGQPVHEHLCRCIRVSAPPQCSVCTCVHLLLHQRQQPNLHVQFL